MRSESKLPCPSFSKAILDVEKATKLGLIAAFLNGRSKNDRGTVDNVRRAHCVETEVKNRGEDRVKLRNDNISMIDCAELFLGL